ncbi:MAG: tetratricopeptide repeat protein [Candidatus Riflebacteria bacterium]|nr:tetratricopeptide repeat protein [Candidatus Riflebacteria bacterium]
MNFLHEFNARPRRPGVGCMPEGLISAVQSVFSETSKISQIHVVRTFLILSIIWAFGLSVICAAPAPPLPSSMARHEVLSVFDQAMDSYEEGYRRYLRGDFPEAERFWKHALELEPNMIKAHYWLGKLYREMGRLGDSLSHWEEAIRLTNLIGDRRKALQTENNEYPAFDQIKITKERERKAAESFMLGRNFLYEGQWNAAIAEFKEAVTAYPANSEYLLMLARVSKDGGDGTGSRKAYSRLLELPDVSHEFQLEAIDSLIAGNDIEPAARALRGMLKTNPMDEDVRRRLAPLEREAPSSVAAAGRVLSRLDRQIVLDLGLDRGLKLADEYSLGLRSFRPGDPVIDPNTGKVLGRLPDTISGELLVTKVFARSAWALIRKQFGSGVKVGDLVEIADGKRR